MITKVLYFTPILIILIFTISINAQNIDYYTTDSINELFTDLNESGDFNGTVLVAKGDAIIFEGTYGFANAKKELLTQDHRYGIGSVYKELPAIAIMQLQEKGFVAIKDPISKYLTSLPEWSTKMTVLNLLQYTAGLPPVNWGKHKDITDQALWADLSELETLAFIPGTDYLYTNNSPFLLSKIVESVSGKSFANYAEEYILKPSGISENLFESVFPYFETTLLASPINDGFEEDQLPFKIKAPLLLFTPSTKDFHKLLSSLHAYKLISQESLAILGKNADLPVNNMQSPLGNVTFADKNLIKHMHHGSSGNFEVLISRTAKDKTTIVIFTNRKKSNLFDIEEQLHILIK